MTERRVLHETGNHGRHRIVVREPNGQEIFGAWVSYQSIAEWYEGTGVRGVEVDYTRLRYTAVTEYFHFNNKGGIVMTMSSVSEECNPPESKERICLCGETTLPDARADMPDEEPAGRVHICPKCNREWAWYSFVNERGGWDLCDSSTYGWLLGPNGEKVYRV